MTCVVPQCFITSPARYANWDHIGECSGGRCCRTCVSFVLQERTRERERVGGSRKRFLYWYWYWYCSVWVLVLGLSWPTFGRTALQRLEGEIEDGGARGLRIFVDCSGFRPVERLGDRSEEEGDHRGI